MTDNLTVNIFKLEDGTEMAEATSDRGGFAYVRVVCDYIEPGGWRKSFFDMKNTLVTARSKNGKLRAWIEAY